MPRKYNRSTSLNDWLHGNATAIPDSDESLEDISKTACNDVNGKVPSSSWYSLSWPPKQSMLVRKKVLTRVDGLTPHLQSNTTDVDRPVIGEDADSNFDNKESTFDESEIGRNATLSTIPELPSNFGGTFTRSELNEIGTMNRLKREKRLMKHSVASRDNPVNYRQNSTDEEKVRRKYLSHQSDKTSTAHSHRYSNGNNNVRPMDKMDTKDSHTESNVDLESKRRRKRYLVVIPIVILVTIFAIIAAVVAIVLTSGSRLPLHSSNTEIGIGVYLVSMRFNVSYDIQLSGYMSQLYFLYQSDICNVIELILVNLNLLTTPGYRYYCQALQFWKGSVNCAMLVNLTWSSTSRELQDALVSQLTAAPQNDSIQLFLQQYMPFSSSITAVDYVGFNGTIVTIANPTTVTSRVDNSTLYFNATAKLTNTSSSTHPNVTMVFRASNTTVLGMSTGKTAVRTSSTALNTTAQTVSNSRGFTTISLTTRLNTTAPATSSSNKLPTCNSSSIVMSLSTGFSKNSNQTSWTTMSSYETKSKIENTTIASFTDITNNSTVNNSETTTNI